MQKLYEWYDWDSLLTCKLLFPILLIKSRCSFLFRSKYIYAAVLWMSRSLFFFSKKVKESQTGGVPKAPRSQPFRPACFQENQSSSCLVLFHLQFEVELVIRPASRSHQAFACMSSVSERARLKKRRSSSSSYRTQCTSIIFSAHRSSE